MTVPIRPNDSTLPVTNGEREHFIPLSKRDLISLVASDVDLSPAEREKFLALCRLLEATFHFEYHHQLDALKDAYAPFDPDADTVPLAPISSEGRQAVLESLFSQFQSLLERANFRPLSRDEIEKALQAASHSGVNLNLDFDVFERLDVYVRGNVISRRRRRIPWKPWKFETVDVPTYQRLVVIFRLRNHGALDRKADTESVFLKIFKNIPHDDVEMLLPGTRVRMTLLDQAKIWLPTLSGLSIALFKIAKGALLLAFAGLYGLLAFVGLVGGTIGYGVKSFLGFLRTKDKYQLNLTRSLYFQNLDNNAGVLCRLLDEAEEQELRETVLAYFLLWRHAPSEGWTMQQIDQAAEQYLEETVGLKVDFEVDDAVAKLLRLGIGQKRGGDRYSAVGVETALVRLDEAWDNFFDYHHPPSQESARRAA
ncbi:MAG: TMEM143 family protein [Pirellulaceae bacterium]